jgi:hypothetical protein
MLVKCHETGARIDLPQALRHRSAGAAVEG